VYDTYAQHVQKFRLAVTLNMMGSDFNTRDEHAHTDSTHRQTQFVCLIESNDQFPRHRYMHMHTHTHTRTAHAKFHTAYFVYDNVKSSDSWRMMSPTFGLRSSIMRFRNLCMHACIHMYGYGLGLRSSIVRFRNLCMRVCMHLYVCVPFCDLHRGE
jgi:hypothetical protein